MPQRWVSRLAFVAHQPAVLGRLSSMPVTPFYPDALSNHHALFRHSFSLFLSSDHIACASLASDVQFYCGQKISSHYHC